MDLKLNFDTPSYEWNVYLGKTFSVQVRGWKHPSGTDWSWNVYAFIYDTHPLFNDVKHAKDVLPFHWGTSLANIVTTAPAEGIQYEWQRESRVLKLGSDYQHYQDDYTECDPKDGIPWAIRNDSEALIHALLEYDNNELIPHKE